MHGQHEADARRIAELEQQVDSTETYAARQLEMQVYQINFREEAVRQARAEMRERCAGVVEGPVLGLSFLGPSRQAVIAAAIRAIPDKPQEKEGQLAKVESLVLILCAKCKDSATVPKGSELDKGRLCHSCYVATR